MKETAERSYRYTKGIPDGYKSNKVRVDRTLGSEERKTVILLDDGRNEPEISSARKVVVGYLLGHPNFPPQELTRLGETILGISGDIPKNWVLTTARPRHEFSSSLKRRETKG